MCGHSRTAGAVTHTGPIDLLFSATLRRGPYCRCRFNLVLFSVKDGTQIKTLLGVLQFTKRRMRTFITIPSARNVNITDEPP
jgi:hypothetical protein